MAHAILMPKPGQMTEECTLIVWRKAEGDVVHKGDVLFEIETDKSVMEVESFDEGVLLRQVVPQGATVPVSAVCAWIGEAGETIPDPDDEPAVAPAAMVAEPASVGAADPTRLADPDESGPTAEEDAPPRSSGIAGPDDARLRISPRASLLAASSGVDPRAIRGSGPDGRITERDVQAAIAESSRTPVSATAAPDARSSRPSAAPPHPVGPDEIVEPMSRMRRVISERLTQSRTTTPHFTITVAANLYGLLALRMELKQGGMKLSVTDFVLTAVAQTLVEFPDVNTRLDGTDLVRRERVHLGLAVSVPGGLLVPVVRDAHLLSVIGMHQRAQALIAGARSGALGPDELGGSTFTVSNLGMFDVEEFSAIINPGESAILAVASAVLMPIAIGEGIAIRPIMKLTLSADHRVVDGETGAKFPGGRPPTPRGRRRVPEPDTHGVALSFATNAGGTMSATSQLRALGQSLWLDNITRPMLTTGVLQHYIDDLDLTGLTSNPTIYDRAIAASDAYAAQIAERAAAGDGPEDTFFELALQDLRDAADMFRPVYDRTDGVDGFVSLEVSPLLAFDAEQTLAEARRLHAKGARDNLFIKIPGTPEGLHAVEEAIFAGVPVNVTLLFSPAQYLACAATYTRAIERRVTAGLPAYVPSVASLFLSRWDTAVADVVPAALKLQLGLAIGRAAYAAYVAHHGTERWDRLRAAGARPQRLLFASTGAKDPTASPVMYVTGLAAPGTVNTMPEETLLALADYTGDIAALPTDPAPSAAVLAEFAAAGIDIDTLGQQLQQKGAASFVASWTSLLERLARERARPVLSRGG